MTQPDADAPTQADPAAWPTRPDAPKFGPDPVPSGRVDTFVASPPALSPTPLAEPMVAMPPPDRRIGAGMLLALAVGVLVAAGIAIAWFLTHRSPSASPPVRTILVTTSGTQQRVKRGASVMLVAVPHLVGDKISDAQRTLEQLGLKSTEKNASSRQPAGTVLNQAPAADSSAPHGTVVALTVAAPPQGGVPTTTPPTVTTATGTTTTAATTTAPTATPAAPATPQTATVPDVSGKDEISAMQALVAAGVLPSIVFVPAQTTLGTVVQTARPAGTQLGYHDHMQVNLSSGPGNKPMEQVPTVIGQSLEQAVAKLQAAGLRLIFVKLPVTSRVAAGKIVQQTPAAGQAPHNARILVFLAAYRTN